jgi:predicted Zn-dependent protease
VAVILLPAPWAQGHGSYHEIIAELDRKIAAWPDDATLHVRRAFLHLEHGDWEASLVDADVADRLTKADLATDLIRGRALAAGGRLPEAKAVLDRFVAAHPGNPAGLMQRARVRGELGEAAQAADDFVLGMSGTREPEPDQVFELAAFFCKAGKRDAALEALDAALKRMRGLQSLVDRAVEIEMELERPGAALRRMDEAIEAARVKEPLLAKRASLLARAGRTRDSIAEWKGLQERILVMPPLERGSHAMSRLLEQARHAVESLASLSPE